MCGTCQFFFERLGGATKGISPTEVVESLNDDLSYLAPDVVDKVAELVPNGTYHVMLLQCFPKLVELNGTLDYFSHEQTKLWAIDPFWGFPHNPKIQYYRGTDQPINVNERLFEFLIPMFPQGWLQSERVDYYEDMLEYNKTPTAVALSILDVKAPAVSLGDTEPLVSGHWCLAHYVLDGHHKLYAASKLKKPVNILSFLSVDESVISSKNDLQKLLNELAKSA